MYKNDPKDWSHTFPELQEGQRGQIMIPQKIYFIKNERKLNVDTENGLKLSDRTMDGEVRA